MNLSNRKFKFQILNSVTYSQFALKCFENCERNLNVSPRWHDSSSQLDILNCELYGVIYKKK